MRARGNDCFAIAAHFVSFVDSICWQKFYILWNASAPIYHLSSFRDYPRCIIVAVDVHERQFDATVARIQFRESVLAKHDNVDILRHAKRAQSRCVAPRFRSAHLSAIVLERRPVALDIDTKPIRIARDIVDNQATHRCVCHCWMAKKGGNGAKHAVAVGVDAHAF